MIAREIERCLDIGRDALVLLSELLVSGKKSRAELYRRARAEADALTCLLDEAPEAKAADIHYLLDRYDSFLARLVN